MARTITVIVGFLVLPVGVSAGDGARAKSVEAIEALLNAGKTKEVRALGDEAIPALAELFKANKHWSLILPMLANSKTKLARTTIEAALREDDDDRLFWHARALGLLKNPESKSALLESLPRLKKRLSDLDRQTPDEPDGLGVLFGGTSDGAFFSVIWALGRIEGKDFGTSWLEKDKAGDFKLSGPLDARDLSACIEWWREYKKIIATKNSR